MTLYHWSQTAASNATADVTCPMPEGMSPSSVNDGIRGAMAAVAKYRDDISGQIVTAGTSSAYTLTSFQGFDSLADMHGKMVALSPHTTNAAGPITLNVDGLGAKPFRTAPNTEFLAGVLIQGTPYMAVYNNTDGAWYAHSYFGNPFSCPVAGGMSYYAATAPNSYFALPYGQAISRTTYATLFGLIGTTFGAGDGSTTFNLPDERGKTQACPDNMGGTAANLLTSTYFGSSAVLGAVGGSDHHLLTTAEMPAHNHGVTDPGHVHAENLPMSGGGTTWNNMNGAGNTAATFVGPNTSSATTGISIQNNGGGGAHAIVPPTICVNKIIRII